MHFIQTLRAFRLANFAGFGSWKMDPWASKMGLGSSKSEPKWVPGGENRGLEGPGTSKIGSWTAWKPVWRAWSSPGRPSWGSKGRFGRHLGVTRAPREAFRGRFWRILGVPNGSGKAIFWIRSGKVQNGKIICFPMCFNDFWGSGALDIDQNGVKWPSKWVRSGSWTQNMHLGG